MRVCILIAALFVPGIASAEGSPLGQLGVGVTGLTLAPSVVEGRGELYLGSRVSLVGTLGIDVLASSIVEEPLGRARAMGRVYVIGSNDTSGLHASAGAGVTADLTGGSEPFYAVPVALGYKFAGSTVGFDLAGSYHIPMYLDDFLGSDPQAGLALLGLWSVEAHITF